MPKSGRTKKQKRQEKAKVQIKKSTKLPKGQNITDTSFKAKKIVLKEQLKPATGNEPLTKRKLGIKELLSHLQRSSTPMKLDGLNGLEELITSNPEIVSPNLALLVGKLAEMIVDKEGAVRQSAIQLLQKVLAKVYPEQLSPFFPILAAHLSCAMTHINESIQEDSLLLMDVLLANHSGFITTAAPKILPNFLELISMRKEPDGGGTSSRILTTNLNQRGSSLKWRVRVLGRLHGFLRCMLCEKRDAENKPKSLIGSTATPAGTVENHSVRTVRWTAEEPLYVPIYITNYSDLYNPKVSCLSIHSLGKPDQGAAFRDEDQIKEYITVLVPLLFETWMEVGPSQKDMLQPGNMLSVDATEVLECILEIMQSLWEYVLWWEGDRNTNTLSQWFKTTYQKEFTQYFLSWFPYYQKPARRTRERERVRRQGEVAGTSLPSDSMGELLGCANQNLAISYLFCSLNDEPVPYISNSVVDFVASCLDTCETRYFDMQYMARVLDMLLVVRSAQWGKAGVDVTSLLQAAVASYSSIPTLKDQAPLFELLCNIVLNAGLPHLHRCSGLTRWLSCLPELLCQESVPLRAVQAMQRVACQGNQVFLRSLQHRLPEILGNLPSLNVVGLDRVEGQKNIINILFWVKDWNKQAIDLLGEKIMRAQLDWDVINYIIGIFNYKIEHQSANSLCKVLCTTTWWRKMNT